jgi:predicted nucleic acid-binding protein
VSRTIVDTSVFIEAERRNLQALERLHALLEQDAVAVSVVSVVELMASSTLPADRRRFYATLFAGQAGVLPATTRGAAAGIDAARVAGGARTPDILIAGTAIEHGLKVVTFDAGLARLLGPQAELLRAS